MVSGFLGTLVSLERAVALRLRWTYLASLATALGALLLAGLPDWPGPLLITLGSLGLVAIFAVIVRRHPAPYTRTMASGAVCWLVGNALWLLGRPVYQVVFWWAAFLILTIAGERLELSRVLRPPRRAWILFLITLAIFGVGLLLSVPLPDFGLRLAAIGMLGLAAWLMRYDIARRTVRQTGLTRYIALCLLAGYIWLAIGGSLVWMFAGAMAGPLYDAMLHPIFLGFVMSMIFGHVPIIFPAVLGVPMAFRPSFYIHLVLLHSSLALRILGDLAGWPEVRQWGGLLNVLAVLLFLASMLYAIRQLARAAQPASSSLPAQGPGRL
jgi:hypothetical protein